MIRGHQASRLLGAAKLQSTPGADNPCYVTFITSLFKKCFCDHRNAQKRSPDSSHSQPAGDVYETPNRTGQDAQPQYDVIQLGHTQHDGPDADAYVALNPQTQGLEPHYDVVSRPQADRPTDAPIYVNVM